MNNKEYANEFQTLAKLMELHGENSYRIKSYSNAYRIIRSVSDPIHEMTLADVKSIKGIGDAIGQKIQEIRKDGKMQMLEQYKEKTPTGIVQLLAIKGLGVKKIKVLWEELQVQSPGELLYACQENRLVSLKGFGQKTQDNMLRQLEYYMQSRDKFHYAKLEEEAENLILDIQETLSTNLVSLTGKIRRLEPILENITILIGKEHIKSLFEEKIVELVEHKPGSSVYKCSSIDPQFPVLLLTCPPEFWGYNLFRTTATEKFNQDFFDYFYPDKINWKQSNPAALSDMTETDIFEKAGVDFINPEIRDIPKILFKLKDKKTPLLIEKKDIKGIIHAHSTWSDGSDKLADLAKYVKEQGFEYLGITDHSQSAFYANGLKADRVLQQMEEIDQLNADLAPFKIFKGIESDILYDGSLDYPEAILSKFDFVIASIHSTLRMNKEKATQRLLTAIQNPYTTILGHPTGRILLSREGYPIDHEAIIDACAKHHVIIEINANPLRLDLDYTWIPYALEQGVRLAINPDAHSLKGVQDIHYGTLVARKGMLQKEQCLNCLDKEAFESYLLKRNLQR